MEVVLFSQFKLIKPILHSKSWFKFPKLFETKIFVNGPCNIHKFGRMKCDKLSPASFAWSMHIYHLRWIAQQVKAGESFQVEPSRWPGLSVIWITRLS